MNQILNIDFDRIICEDFLGMNAVWHYFAVTQESELWGETDEDLEREIAFAKRAKLKIARTYIKPSINCERIEGPYNMQCKRMQGLRKWCQKLKDNGIDIALQAGWHFPDDTCYGHDDLKPERDIPAFCEWVYQYISYLVCDCGLDNIKYLILFTEPTTNEDRRIPEGYPDSWSYYVPLCKALDTRFREGGLRDRIKFVGPNNSERGRHVAEAVRDLNDAIDIFSGHFYNYVHHWEWLKMSKEFTEAVAPTGKPFWMDEYGMQLEVFRNTPQYGTYLAQIVAASVSAGHQTTFLWTLFDQLFPNGNPCEMNPCTKENYKGTYNIDSFHHGVHRWGLKYWEHDDHENAGELYPAWYAYCMLANALGDEGASSCYSEDALTVYSCAVKSGDSITVVAINSNATPAEITVNSNGGDRTLYRYCFSPWSDSKSYETEDEPKVIEMKNGAIVDCLPKGGICIYRSEKIEY